MLVQRFGRYVLLSDDSLDKAEAWFKHYGDWAIFLTRFVPLVRTLISFPAGIAKYDLKRVHILYTTLGSLIWNAVLAYLEYLVRPRMGEHHRLLRPLFIVGIGRPHNNRGWWWVLHRLREMGRLPSAKKGKEGV